MCRSKLIASACMGRLCVATRRVLLYGGNIRLRQKVYESQRNAEKLLTQHAVSMTTTQNHLA